MEPVTVVIDLEEYLDLKRDQNFLYCLYDSGVDNWEGYNLAQETFDRLYPDALD